MDIDLINTLLDVAQVGLCLVGGLVWYVTGKY